MNQERKTIIDYYSFTSIPLKMFFDEQELAHGTAFFYTRNNNTYLITNWHNLSGINPHTGQYLSKSTGALPNRIIYEYIIYNSEGKKLRVDIPLKTDGLFIWKQYRQVKQVDIAVIPLLFRDNAMPLSITENNQCLDMDIQIGMDVFILGFPIKCFTDIIPVWKRATIATEPNLLIDGLPKMLLDTATHQGMSGSPVLLRSCNGYISIDNRYIMTGGISTRFLGIYSGRHLGNPELGNATLGVIWKKELIDTIIDEGVAGSQSLES